jgi:mycothiol synthase
VNNAAFATHPEQGGWTHSTIESREHEPWFEPAGFLMRWHGDDLEGFCWTKVHVDTDPPMGEIYVIGVDPSHMGRGLGRRLAVAGLHHLSTRGLGTAMLYVDSTNDAAISMYSRMGFTHHHLEHAFVGDIAPSATTAG